MQLALSDIRKPIEKELEEFNSYFKSVMKSKVFLLDIITNYLLKRKGKQMRPLFVLFSAKLFGDITPMTYRAAALIELLHTATLVHDDVVDDAEERRGFFSLNALWKNKVAVLVGDFLLSRGLLLSLENKDYYLLEIVSQAVKQMSEGELLQIEKARRMDITEEIYFEIIRQKTATLIAAACACGAASIVNDKNIIDKMWTLGEKIGMAFQIKDDLLDYGEDDIGKPRGNDMMEKKMTLPLIHALNLTNWLERRKIIGLIKNHSEDKHKVQRVIDFVKEHEGLDYSSMKMHQFKEGGLKILSRLSESEAKKSLRQLVEFTIEREN